MLDFEKISEIANTSYKPDNKRFLEILSKAKHLDELSLEEVGFLLSITDKEMVETLCNVAFEVKKTVFGNRIVLFAPLYLSNECANKCLYCGFQQGNIYEKRKTLTVDEAVEEARFLTQRGFRRTLLVTAENRAKCGVDYIVEVVKNIYEKTEMDILHLNAAPMEIEELKKIRESGVGVFQVFQETYHEGTYKTFHVAGKKKDFQYRLTCMNRALEAGFKDVGIGCLLGLYDYHFDVLATIAHGKYLRDNYGTHPHTISVPRLRYAKGASVEKPPYPVDDFTFKKIVAIYRIAIPTAGVVISTREPAYLRDEVLMCGASQISAESSTAPGGYTGKLSHENGSQFSLSDRRSLEEVVISILEKGMIPSFCTACYRKGREGVVFHNLAKNGVIKNLCEENAINTLLNYIGKKANESHRQKILELFEKNYNFCNTLEETRCALK